jgi:hypothetical protein
MWWRENRWVPFIEGIFCYLILIKVPVVFLSKANRFESRYRLHIKMLFHFKWILDCRRWLENLWFPFLEATFYSRVHTSPLKRIDINTQYIRVQFVLTNSVRQPCSIRFSQTGSSYVALKMLCEHLDSH